MLRQYQVQRAATNGSLIEVSWSLKDRREETNVPHAQPMSTKVLAVGVLLVGALILAVALIMGLEFPKYVHSQLREDQCVLHTQHEKYQTWRSGMQWSRHVRLYYWEIENEEEFLYRGAIPSIRERGPYIYKEDEIREDVVFSNPEVSFRVSRSHEFDVTQTSEECTKCYENDTIRLFNTEFLRNVYRTGGEENYVMSLLQPSIENVLTSLGLYLTDTFAPNITALGCLDQACDNSHTYSSQVLANISFGVWLRSSNATYASAIRANRTTSFTAAEVGGLYKVLVNASLLGSGVLVLGPEGVSLYSNCRSWARAVCLGQTVPARFANLSLQSCGIVHLLYECDAGSAQFPEVRQSFASAFCTHDGAWCLDLNSTDSALLAVYIEALSDFVLLHLVKCVHDVALIQNDKDLLMTRSQKDLALGYTEVNDVVGSGVNHHVPGVLSESWVKSEVNSGALWVASTCLQDRDMNNNMKIKEFNGSPFAPQTLLKDPLREVPVSGHTDFVDACNPLVTCQSCTTQISNFYFFLPTLWRTVKYVLGNKTSLWGVDVYRYWLSADTFSNDDSYDVRCGLQSMSSVLGFIGWMSVPHNRVSSLQLGQSAGTICVTPVPDSFVDVEPVTGRLWQKSTKLQLNIGLRSIDVAAPRWRPFNLTFLENAIPLVWIERRVMLSSTEFEYYEHKVTRLMKVSCGGLIGLSVVAVMVMISSIFVIFHPKPNNRVAPMLEESSVTNIHSRHHTGN